MTKSAGLLEMPGVQQKERVSARTGRDAKAPVSGNGKHFFVEYLLQEKNRRQHAPQREEAHQGAAMTQDQFLAFFEALRRDIALNRLELRQLEARMDDWRVQWKKNETEQSQAGHEALIENNNAGSKAPSIKPVETQETETRFTEGAFVEEEDVRSKKEYLRHWREVYRKRYPVRELQPLKKSPEEKKDLRFFVQEIKRLEEKKAELIQDNIMINQLSEELLAENQRLQGELERLSSGGRKAS